MHRKSMNLSPVGPRCYFFKEMIILQSDNRFKSRRRNISGIPVLDCHCSQKCATCTPCVANNVQSADFGSAAAGCAETARGEASDSWANVSRCRICQNTGTGN